MKFYFGMFEKRNENNKFGIEAQCVLEKTMLQCRILHSHDEFGLSIENFSQFSRIFYVVQTLCYATKFSNLYCWI